ncbi:hypothetical protein [Cypionkella sp. TWP1-2-1b2]|uniref:linalool dehydratase/isomerase domain-containing protein n=1 Tax=Cypionkella sp. TWP1-2-1b2 TaxID=2804675 RepID=UPI003CEABAE4
MPNADPSLFPKLTHLHGPQTRRLLRRSVAIYVVLYGIAVALLLLAPATWAGFALGLMAPGAGFAAGWSMLAGGALFGVALLIWFATGNVLLPPMVWLGAAWLAVENTPSPSQKSTVPVLIILGFAALWLWQHHALYRAKNHRLRLNAHLAVCPALPAPPPSADALSPADLARLRLLLDRALQPVETFNGFEHRDPFQTAALRYQVNFVAFALALVQAQYAPACKGYLHQAQDNLLIKIQNPKVWRYWAWENLWGNLRHDPDPIRQGNIMYAGFVAAQIALRANACGYPFDATQVQVSGGQSFAYSQPQIIETLTRQYETSRLGLLPCEPNWVYPLCNLITAAAIRAHANRHGTQHWARISGCLRAGLEAEFIGAGGTFLAFRSSLTGIVAPAVGGALMQGYPCVYLNAVAPDMAQRQWQTLRFARQGRDWRRAIWRLDVGNYGLSRAAGYTGLALAAREIGDEAAAADLLALLEADCPEVIAAGVAHRESASLWALAHEVMARAHRAGGLAALMQPQVGAGPYIEAVDYAETLVAKARNTAGGLEIVLDPRQPGQSQSLVFARLHPNHTYLLRGDINGRLIADAQGKAALQLVLSQRTAFVLYPEEGETP